MMNRARSGPPCCTTASSESIHSWVSTGSMSGSCCLNWSKISRTCRSIGAYGTDRCREVATGRSVAPGKRSPSGVRDPAPMPSGSGDARGRIAGVGEWPSMSRRGPPCNDPLRMRTIYRSEPPWPHRILILGGGVAGVETARHLEKLNQRRADVEIWVVSRENFTLFTPLLPEVCSGMLDARHSVTALRAQLKRPSSWAVTADVQSIDLDEKVVTVLGGDGDLHRLHYDTLILALGGETATFGIKGIHDWAVGMKTLADAFALRNRIVEMLERADLETDPEMRLAQLSFVV